MGLRVGVGVGPFYASAGLPKLGIGRGVSAYISFSFMLLFWMLKLMVLMSWWTVKLVIIGLIWIGSTTEALVRARRQAPPT